MTSISARRHSLRRAITAASTIIVILLAAWTYLFVNAVNVAISDVRALESLRAQPAATISPGELENASSRFESLQISLQRIDRLTQLPPVERQIVEHLPWAGNRYVASRHVIRFGLSLGDAGGVGSSLAAQALNAYETTGVTVPASSDRETWLDVLAHNAASLDRIQRDVDVASQERTTIDTAALPSALRRQLRVSDQVFERYANDLTATRADLSSVVTGLGGNKPMRYLVLFQNPAELRPSGGFPGTMGLVTISRGQLLSYQIFDGHTLTDAYIAQRQSTRPEPWPIDHYFPQDGFLLHDAGWYADFPKAGSMIMSMYSETDWAPIDGVIAIQPSVVADLLQVTGPLDVEIDGESRHVTAANVYDEIERQRRLIVEGIKPWDTSRQVHKEAVASIGEAIIARMKTADRLKIMAAAKLLMHSADVRDIQAYAADPALESSLDRHRWTGRLDPDPRTPAVAITFANVALQKSSEFMHPSLDFAVSAASSGIRTVTLDIKVANTGPLGEDPLYSGYQDWWIQVALPGDYRLLSSSERAQPDPESPNGGSYAVGVNPQTVTEMTVVFEMPAGSQFLLRRQPGLTNATVAVVNAGCANSTQFTLTRDQTVDVSALCNP